MSNQDFLEIESGAAFRDVPFKSIRFCFILMIAGLVLLVFTAKIPTPVLYPEYVYVGQTGTEIQKMVMEQVVGDRLSIDLFSDLLGLAFLILSAVGMFACNVSASLAFEKIEGDPDVLRAKGIPVRSEKLLKPNFRLFRGVLICVAGLVLYVVKMFIPFFATGMNLYGAVYGLSFAVALCICLGMLHSIFGFTAMCENADNHRNNMLTEIWIVLTCICTFVYSMGDFYQINSVRWIYTAGKILFLVLTVVGLMAGRHYLYTGEFSYERDKVGKEG